MTRTGTQITVDGRPALRFERRLRHAPERVWRAVTDPAELATWFVAPVPWTPEPGEAWEAGGVRGAITELDAPRRLAWTWGEERYSFDLAPDGDGTLLVFLHVVAPEMPPAQTAAGWETYLDRLASSLAGTPRGEEDAHGAFATYHEAHAAALGIDPAQGRHFAVAALGFRDLTLGDGPVLRLERVLPAPVDRVWSMLTDPDDLAHWFPLAAGPLETVRAEPPTRLEARWCGDVLRFELHDDAVGCRLVFTHTFGDRDVAARTAAGWDRCLARFEAWLAGVDLTDAASLELWPLVHERYAQTFGVDPEVGRRAFAQHSND